MSSVKNKKMIFKKIEGYFRNDFKGVGAQDLVPLR